MPVSFSGKSTSGLLTSGATLGECGRSPHPASRFSSSVRLPCFQTHVPVLILATMRGPAAAVDFGLLIRLLFVMMSVLAMITAPLWPAIMRARAEEDHEWIRKSLRLSGALVIGAGMVSMIVLVLFGGQVLWLWTGRKLLEPTIFHILFGIYFLQMAWSHYWAVVLIGLARERLVAVVLISEGTLILMVGTFLAGRWGATGMILGAVTAFALVSNWSLPFFCWRAAGAARKSPLYLLPETARNESRPLKTLPISSALL